MASGLTASPMNRNHQQRPKKGFEGAASDAGWIMPLLSCIAYSSCSLSVVLANKFLSKRCRPIWLFVRLILPATLVHSFDIDINRAAYSLALLMFQALCNLAIFVVCYLLRVKSMQVKSMEWPKVLKWLPVNVLFVSMLFTGFVSLKYNRLTMVTLFKNLTNILTVAGDWQIYKKQVSTPIVGALFVMILGAFMSAYHDLHFTAQGCMWMVGNCVTTSSYVLYLRKVTTDKTLQLSKMDMVFYNSSLTVACTALALFCSGNVPAILGSALLTQPDFWKVASLSGLAGFGLSITSFWCVSATGATTYAITGALNKTPLVGFDIWWFGAEFTEKQAMFVTTGLLGGFLYSYAKILERRTVASPKKE